MKFYIILFPNLGGEMVRTFSRSTLSDVLCLFFAGHRLTANCHLEWPQLVSCISGSPLLMVSFTLRVVHQFFVATSFSDVWVGSLPLDLCLAC
jgi:hypothetical protein